MLAALLLSTQAWVGPTFSLAPRRAVAPSMGLLDGLLGGMATKGFGPPVVMGTEEMMSQKEFGTSAVPCQKNLRWMCDEQVADRICNYNRHYAEYGGAPPTSVPFFFRVLTQSCLWFAQATGSVPRRSCKRSPTNLARSPSTIRTRANPCSMVQRSVPGTTSCESPRHTAGPRSVIRR